MLGLLHPQVRKDVSSLSTAQTEASQVASTPADAPHLPETAVQGEGAEPEGEGDSKDQEESPNGASLAQETPALQEGMCGWVKLRYRDISAK